MNINQVYNLIKGLIYFGTFPFVYVTLQTIFQVPFLYWFDIGIFMPFAIVVLSFMTGLWWTAAFQFAERNQSYPFCFYRAIITGPIVISLLGWGVLLMENLKEATFVLATVYTIQYFYEIKLKSYSILPEKLYNIRQVPLIISILCLWIIAIVN